MLVTTSYSNYSVNQGVNSNSGSGVNADIAQQPVNKVSEADSSFRNYEREAIQQYEKDQAEKSSQQPSKPQERFDVDEASLALALSINKNESSLNSKQSKNTLDYDAPSNSNLTAVSAYQNVDNIAKRESVRDVFGIDLFA